MNDLTQAGQPKSVSHSANIEGVVGVRWLKSKQQWRVRIYLMGEPVILGYFDDLHEAIAARKAAEKLPEYTRQYTAEGQAEIDAKRAHKRQHQPHKVAPKPVRYPGWIPVAMRAGIVLGGLAMLGHALV